MSKVKSRKSSQITKSAKSAKSAAIPMAIREEKKPLSARDLTLRLAGMGKKSPPNGDKGKKRPVLEMSPQAETLFLRVAPLKVILDKVEKITKIEIDQLKDLVRGEYINLYWNAQTQPENPALIGRVNGQVEATGMFLCVAKWRIAPLSTRHGELPEDEMIKRLTVVGLGLDAARELVKNEIDFTPRVIIPITDLANSNDADEVGTNAANQLMSYLIGETNTLELDEEQKIALIVVEAKTKVLEGFMQRLCRYCTTKEQVEAILTFVICPEWHFRSIKFGEKMPDKVRNTRLLGLCKEILE